MGTYASRLGRGRPERTLLRLRGRSARPMPRGPGGSHGNTKGAVDNGALRYYLAGIAVLARTQHRRDEFRHQNGGVTVGLRLGRSASDLVAGHLQGPASTVRQVDHLLSLVIQKIHILTAEHRRFGAPPAVNAGKRRVSLGGQSVAGGDRQILLPVRRDRGAGDLDEDVRVGSTRRPREHHARLAW